MRFSFVPSKWSYLLPSWPLVPTRLWLALIAAAVAGLNLFFWKEIWPNTPEACRAWQWVALAAAGLFGVDLLRRLWRWPAAYTGPTWARLLFRLVVVAVVSGLVAVGGLLLLIAVLLSSRQ